MRLRALTISREIIMSDSTLSLVDFNDHTEHEISLQEHVYHVIDVVNDVARRLLQENNHANAAGDYDGQVLPVSLGLKG